MDLNSALSQLQIFGWSKQNIPKIEYAAVTMLFGGCYFSNTVIPCIVSALGQFPPLNSFRTVTLGLMYCDLLIYKFKKGQFTRKLYADLCLSYFDLSYVFSGHNDSVERGLTVHDNSNKKRQDRQNDGLTRLRSRRAV